MQALPEEQFAMEVVERLRSAGHQALWAGGCVRDLLLGRRPTDYDVATSATPQAVRRLFGKQRTLPVGISFGVVIVLAPTKAAGQVEVATFRSDSGYSDGRHPDAVTFSTPEEDAQRRDFTINGMFYDPTEKRVIDFVDGQRDLRDGIIRAIGNADDRIAEDKLRMLRAVRFAARFEFQIEPQTLAAITRHAAEISLVSGERVADELRKTLQTAQAAWAVGSWATTGLLNQILPQVAQHWNSRGPRVLELLAAMPAADWLSRFGGLLWGGLPPETYHTILDDLKHRLKLSNDERAALGFAITSQAQLDGALRAAWSQMQPLVINQHIETAQNVLEARACGNANLRNVADWLREKRSQPRPQLDPPPLVDGGTLMDLGFEPGPQFRELLAQVRSLQLDGILCDQQSAIQWLRATGSRS